MTRDDIISMAREVADPETEDPVSNGYATLTLDELERFFHAAHAAGEQAERDRTKRLVEDMQAELQTLRDRLAKRDT